MAVIAYVVDPAIGAEAFARCGQEKERLFVESKQIAASISKPIAIFVDSETRFFVYTPTNVRKTLTGTAQNSYPGKTLIIITAYNNVKTNRRSSRITLVISNALPFVLSRNTPTGRTGIVVFTVVSVSIPYLTLIPIIIVMYSAVRSGRSSRTANIKTVTPKVVVLRSAPIEI